MAVPWDAISFPEASWLFVKAKTKGHVGSGNEIARDENETDTEHF